MKKTKRPRIISFVILTTITIITWILFDVWRTFQKPLPLEVEPTLLAPISPTLDRQALKHIQERIYISDEEFKLMPANNEGENP